MKIEGGIKSFQGLSGADNKTPNRPAQTPSGNNGEGKVELSALSASLAKAEVRIASTPSVDQKKVDEIKAAISEGRFRVDANRIADGLLDSVRQMLDERSSQ